MPCVVVSVNVSNNSVNNGRSVFLLDGDILKSTMSKGFLMVQNSGYGICPRIF